MPIDLIPAIDLRNGQVVRLKRGDYAQQTTYDVDPIVQAKKFEDAGCTWLHIIDLDGAKEGRPINLAVIEKIIKSTKLRVEVGGGIRNEETMEYILAIGATRLILGTRALADMAWFSEKAHDIRFKNRLVLDLAARDGFISTHGWTQTDAQAPTAIDVAKKVESWPLSAIIYTDIARDGMMTGPNVRATTALTKAVKKIPIIHSGGVKDLSSIKALKGEQICGIIVGKAIYEGTLDVAAAVKELAT
jgi:phosphoribosylformimino-5-aminoimidazole carboxamide ribotide isomerase